MADPLPNSNKDYLDKAYWDARFQSEQQYDWFKGYSQFSHLVTPHIKLTDRILILGCGNSSLTQDLYADGYKHLTSVDLSPVVIQHMQAKAAAAHQDDIKWQVSRLTHCLRASYLKVNHSFFILLSYTSSFTLAYVHELFYASCFASTVHLLLTLT